MKALTLYQPWASLVAIGAKTIETRSWKTDYRGLLLIHAGKRWERDSYQVCARVCEVLLAHGWPHQFLLNRPLGAFVALCTLSDCRAMPEPPDGINRHFGDFGPGRYGWFLEDIRALPEPIPFNGTQGLWLVPRGVQEAVRGQLS